jgi:lysophospholipase L1-like esterase
VELAKLDTNFLRQLNEANYYDLIVLNYGLNVLYKPNDTNFSWYLRRMNTVLKPVIRNLAHADMLIVGASDRAFKYGDNWQTAIGIENLVLGQAELAQANETAFLNLYTTMGGENTIVTWATASPALANKDYVHPNHKGAEKIGTLLGEILEQDIGKPTH